MSITRKTWLLGMCLKDDILRRIDDVEEARQLLDEIKRTGNSRVARMAEDYFEKHERFHITQILSDVGTHVQTKLSVIREAVCYVLEEFIKDSENGGAGVMFEPVHV